MLCTVYMMITVTMQMVCNSLYLLGTGFIGNESSIVNSDSTALLCLIESTMVCDNAIETLSRHCPILTNDCRCYAYQEVSGLYTPDEFRPSCVWIVNPQGSYILTWKLFHLPDITWIRPHWIANMAIMFNDSVKLCDYMRTRRRVDVDCQVTYVITFE